MPSTRTTQNDKKERSVHFFCRQENKGYIDEDTTFAAFKRAQASILSFHEQGLADEALRTAIDEFAAELSDFMFVLNYEEAPGTRPKVRDAIRTPDKDIQELLSTVNDNYSRP